MHPILPLLLLLALATPALAADGTLEINQTCAIETGCFPGDTPGLPVTITTRGGYRLTGNLTLPDANTTGIDVQAAYVDLDLGGFSIVGPVTCTNGGDPPRTTCSATGTGSGIFVAEPFSGAHVHDGVVAGAGFFGALVASFGSIENVKAIDNGGGGLFASVGVLIEGCNASRNGGNGVGGADNVRVSRTTAYENRDSGIELADGATVQGVTASRNAGNGIRAGAGATISGNTVDRNGGGISISSGVISGNSSFRSGQNGISALEGTVEGNTAVESGLNGIVCIQGCTVRGNTVRETTGVGLNLSTSSGFGDNVITDNTSVPVVPSTAPNLGGNFCSGPGTISPTCP